MNTEDWSDASISQGTSNILDKPLDASKRQAKNPPEV
jgi:hypothetical protein